MNVVIATAASSIGYRSTATPPDAEPATVHRSATVVRNPITTGIILMKAVTNIVTVTTMPTTSRRLTVAVM